LWELELLEKHYCPLVSRLVAFFKNPDMFKKTIQPIDCNEFLDTTPNSLIEKELKWKRKTFDRELLMDKRMMMNQKAGNEEYEDGEQEVQGMKQSSTSLRLSQSATNYVYDDAKATEAVNSGVVQKGKQIALAFAPRKENFL
jgi:hypothetical protein